MYLGRIVAIGMTKEGKAAAMYRVSSRSFPNREAVLGNQQVAIMPRPGFEDDLRKNPYITYNCIRLTGEWAVATNGSQTDPIVEKLAMGYPARGDRAAAARDGLRKGFARYAAHCGGGRQQVPQGIPRHRPQGCAAGARIRSGSGAGPLLVHLREEPSLRRSGDR